MKQARTGTDFDSLLKEEGILAECEASAIQRVLAWQTQRRSEQVEIAIEKLATAED